MDKEKLLSIVVPTYNSANYINKLIDTLNKISSSVIEIIYCDDGSRDLTTTLVSNRARNSKILKLQHCGVSNARNTGIRIANGKYITFIDSDDIIRINEFEKIVNILEKYDCDFINVSNSITENHNMQIYHKKEAPFLTKALMGINNYFSEDEIIHAPWAKFYKREFLLKNNIYFMKGIQNGEDLIFNCEVLQHAKTILMLRNSFYIYQIHENSLSYVVPSHLIIDHNQQILKYFNHLLEDGVINKNEMDFCEVKILITNFVRYYRYQEKNIYHDEEKKDTIKIKKIVRKSKTRNLLKNNLTIKLYIFLLLISYTPFCLSNLIIHSKIISSKKNLE
jgi:glycosyltransferase involved in cell wall biosynthesis